MLYQSCWNNLVTGLIVPSSLLQFVNSLFQTCSNKFGTSSANTSCQQLVNRLVTTCLQVCSNLCVFTCVEREVEGPGKGWLSHDQIFLAEKFSLLKNFPCNFASKYDGKFGHVTTSLCRGLCLQMLHYKEALGTRLAFALISISGKTFAS